MHKSTRTAEAPSGNQIHNNIATPQILVSHCGVRKGPFVFYSMYMVVQQDYTPEIEVFEIVFTDVKVKIERDLSNSRQNASISCVKFSWTNQYV